MKILFGCDPNAAALNERLIALTQRLGHETVDMGGDDPIYANTAIAVAEAVAAGKGDRGVLVCGTGLGMSIAANKVKGAYAALLTDVYSAERAVLSNNSNIACMGAFTLGEKLAEELLKIWQKTKKTVIFVTHSIEEATFLSDRVLVMSARPGRVKEMVEIDLPRPRGEATRNDPKFTEYNKYLRGIIG